MKPITQRQAMLIALAARGMSCKEIAREMGIAVNTARVTLQQARERTDCRTVAHLVAKALSSGWIAPLLLALLVGSISPTTEALRVRQPMRTRQQVSTNARVGRRDTGSELA